MRARRASTGVVVVANIGLPNAMTQMVNTYKDQIPMLVAVASIDQDALGRDQWQEIDHHELMTAADHQMVLAGAVDSGDGRDHAARAQIRLDPALRPGIPSLPTNTLSSMPRRRSGSAANSTCRCASAPTRTMSRKRRAC